MIGSWYTHHYALKMLNNNIFIVLLPCLPGFVLKNPRNWRGKLISKQWIFIRLGPKDDKTLDSNLIKLCRYYGKLYNYRENCITNVIADYFHKFLKRELRLALTNRSVNSKVFILLLRNNKNTLKIIYVWGFFSIV